MPVVTYSDFSIGKDLRKGASVADANRLRELKNGYVTTGKAIKKRPGTEKIAELESGTVGIFAAGGVLNTFTASGSVTHANVLRPAKYRPAESSALNDATSSGTYSGTIKTKFIIEIETTGSPDTFKWQKENGALTLGVSITGSAQILSDGVQITFGATTGHTLEDKWEIECLAITPNQVAGSNVNPATFTGAGLNDLGSGGGYTGTGTPTFTIEIDGKTTGSITKYEALNTKPITAMADQSTASITVMADAGGGNTTITSSSHGLSNSARVTISATSSYNGIYTIAAVTTNTFQIVQAFATNEATGTWKADTTITSASHGLSNGNSVVISGTTNYNGTFTISGVATNAFNIVKEFTTNDATGSWELSPNPSSGTTTVTDASHGLTNGNQISISGTTNYNGIFTISGVTTNTFVIADTFVTDDATGTWEIIPNTFRWRKDSGSYTSGVLITGSAQDLQEGVQVTFASKYGHTLTNYWSVQVSGAGVASGVTVSHVHYADVFKGYIYVSVEYSNGATLHHYIDGSSTTRIVDANCPNSKGVVKMEDKIWAISGDTVKFCATSDPRDWTTSQDAGSLAVGLKQKGSDNALALGQYKEKNLIVFFADGSQLWAVDPDPANHAFTQSLPGVHTRYHRSIALLYQDMYMLTDFGFRSISESVLTNSQSEIDVGSPIDSVVQTDLPQTPTVTPKAKFSPNLGQYLCVIGKTIYAFTISKTAKITAWSEYSLPWKVDDWTLLDSQIFLRTGNALYRLTDEVFRDSYETGKSITVFASGGTGITTVTSTSHGRSNSDEVIISGTTNYNGTYTIASATTNTFNIEKTFVANDATGTYTAGTLFEFEMVMAFVDAKKPGILKMFRGVDTVTTGTGRLSFKYIDGSTDSTFTTDEISISGDTRPDVMTPMEISGVSVAPVFKHSANEAFQLDAISLYYENLAPL